MKNGISPPAITPLTMEDCSICWAAIDASTGHCTLSCKHSYHIGCLTQWSSSNPSCPLCRHELSETEVAPRPQARATWDTAGLIQQYRILVRMDDALDLPQLGGNREVAAVVPARFLNRTIHIGGGVYVPENDVTLVMAQTGVPRHLAARALRIHDGDIVNAIMLLAEDPAPPPAVRPRDPVETESDEQATAWFIQQMFGDGGYHWNSYKDMWQRGNRAVWKRHEYWRHREFNDVKCDERGYETE